ncbi:LysM repeat protein [Oxalobacteraceae bacterium GrIS 1.11]
MYEELFAMLAHADAENNAAAREGIRQFINMLGEEKEIRFYVDGTPNFGHQATTVYLMKRLVNLCRFSGKIVMVYADAASGKSTPEKLAQLLTGVVPDTIDTKTVKYGSCEDIIFMKVAAAAALAPVNFGFTGGADDMSVVLANTIRTDFFLRLQPYMWGPANSEPFASRIEFLDQPANAAIKLKDMNATIDLLAYKYDRDIVRKVPAEVWDWYTTQSFNPKLKANTPKAMALAKAAPANPAGCIFWPAYGLHQFGGDNRDVLLNLVIVGLSYQASLGFKGPPIALTLMNDFATLDFTFVNLFAQDNIAEIAKALDEDCLGMMGEAMKRERLPRIAAIIEDLMVLGERLKPSVHMRAANDLTPAEITQLVTNAKPGGLLIIPLGAVPQEIFDYFYANATLPPIFEGQGTSSLMISLGMPYLQTPKQDTEGNNYPSIPPVFKPRGTMPQDCNLIAETLRIGVRNIVVTDYGVDYAEMMATVQQFVSNVSTVQLWIAYFELIGLYYQNDVHDKLLAGCVALYMVAQKPAKSMMQVRAAADAPLDLDAVYTALTTTWRSGSVDLFAALPASYLAKFYGAMGGTTFPIAVQLSDIVTENANGKTTRVSIRNAATSVFPMPFNVSMEFTAENGPVVSDLHCRAPQPWTLDGAPWLGFDNPGFDMRVPEAAAPVIGGMVGTIHGTGLTLQVRYPVESKQWVVTGTFAAPYPGIAAFYQMAGGINLVQTLPAPLSSLAGFGLSECQFIYGPSAADAGKKNIEYLMFVMSTSEPWTIVNNPLLQVNPTVRAVITSPGDLTARSTRFDITGAFMIGGGTIAVTAQYPNFQIAGALTDGSINMGDLGKLFGVDIAALQDADVTGFTLLVQPSIDVYQVAATIAADWPIPNPASPIFTITGLGLNVQGTAGAFTVSLSGTTVVLPGTAKIGVQVAASYTSGSGWTFDGSTTTPVPLGQMVEGYGGFALGDQGDYQLDSIALHIATLDNSWLFKCTASNWKIVFLDLTIDTATLSVGYNGPASLALAHPALGSTSAMTLITGGDEEGRFADVEADIEWAGMAITAWIKFSTSAGPSWGFTLPKYHLHVETSKNSDQQWVASGSIVDMTLGGMVEDLISFATGSSYGLSAPWNLLDSVALDKFALTFNFTTRQVGLQVNIGPIDLGFCSIKSIGINYDSSVLPRKVMLSITGSFPWQSSDTLSWDATKPDEAPSPPGGGNEFLDLRLLALGQHVEVTSKEPLTTVEAVIAALRNLDSDGAPVAGSNHNVKFNANNSWLVGANFGVMKIKDDENKDNARAVTRLGDDSTQDYVIDLSIVFNDPNLYGARIALAGPPAKILGGLVFEILYRRISDTIGVYQINLTLPARMRNIDVGAYSMTLPSIALDIYTNGDFKVDFGFPWNQDFSRSFMVQAIIPPGIPVLGAAGFYFGKLSSATSNQVPTIDNGRFDPVIIFGFGVTVGIGKDVDYGMLKAGFSLTVFGILQGVIAKFCPYPGNSNLPATKGQLQDGYYFELDGTFGIIGMLYGSVDFVVIKASVSVTIKVMAQITYISYHDIPISLIASVDVTASLSIDLGLFSITLHFSFSMTIKETFTIQNPNKSPPWHVSADSRPAMLTAMHRSRLSAASDMRHVMLASNGDVKFYWDNLAPMAQVRLTGYWGPALTVCGDAAAKACDQKVCYVNMLAIASSDPTMPRAPTDTDTSFDLLAQQVLRWVAAAAQPEKKGYYTVDDIDKVLVSPDDLCALLKALTKPTGALPISADDADTFMTNQFTLNVSLPTSGKYNAAPFPIAPKLVLDVPAYGGTPQLTYAFVDFNSASTAYLDMLRTYFDDLTVQVEKETKKQKSLAATADIGTSVASFVFSDYFRLIGQQMIESARDALRSFKYPLTNPPSYGASAGAAVKWINAAGASEFGLADLFEANPTHLFAANQNVFVYGAAAQTGPNATFTLIAAGYDKLFTPLVLATANATTSKLLTANATIIYKGKPYSVSAGDSLNDIAAKAGATLADLLADPSNILAQQGLVDGNATFTVPGGARSQAAKDATFNAIALAYQHLFTGTALASANAASINLLAPGLTIEYPNQTSYTLLPRDSLDSVAAQFGVALADLLQHATVMPDHIGVLDRKGLISTFAPLALPDFSYSATDADTPGSVAQRFGVSVRALGLAANADVTFEQVKVTTLDLSHLAQLKLGALIDEIKRTNGLSRISGMTGRYALHGLRLPTAGLTQNVPLLCGSGADCGLYSLTGQQFAVPALATQDFSFSLAVPNNLTWVKFGGPKLTMTLMPPKDPKNPTASDDQNWLKVAALQSFVASPNYVVSPPGTTIGPEEVYLDQATTWPSTSLTDWHNAGSVTLPYGAPPSGVQALRLWGLPDTLLNLDDANRAAPPRALAMRGEYDEGSGQTVETELTYHGWATKIGLTIKQIPPSAGSPSSAFTYQLIGSGEADIVLLERLLAKLSGHSDPIDSLTLLYPPDANAGMPTGLQSDNSATVTLGILQANLSTVTNPPNAIGAQFALDTQSGGCLNTPYDFVKLLWECSITRSGGYYLYYFESAAGNGFPSRIFNDKGEASLTLLVMQTQPNDTAQQNLVGGFINCMVSGDAFDATRAAVYAKSAPAKATLQPLTTDSLATFAYRYYMDPVALAEANPNATLAAQALTLARGVYQVGASQPGADPNAIAGYFATTLPTLQAANPQVTNWNNPLPPDTVLRLPPLSLTVGSSKGGTTLASLAAYYGSNISEIAADNADMIGLLAVQDLTVSGGPMSRSSTVPAGCIALAASLDVPKPVPPPTDATFAQLYIQNQIVLLGYRIYDNPWFKQTHPGLPISHSDDPPAHLAADRTRTPMRAILNGDAPPWNFQRAIPAAQNAKPDAQNQLTDLPDPSTSPYIGVGGLAQLDLGWVDAFGNTLKSDLGNKPDGSPTRNRSPMPLNYVDALVGLGRWPGVSADYSVQDKVGLAIGLDLVFDPSGYSPDPNDQSPPTDPPGWQVNAAQALHAYNLMYQQLSQTLDSKGNQVPAVTLALSTSLLPATDLTLDAAARARLMTWLFGQGGIYPFLVARSGGDTAFPAPADYPVSFAFQLADINTAQLFELTTTFTLSRPKTLVDPAFADTAGFVSATTTVMPRQVPATDGAYGLAWFARALETCLTQAGAWACKLASGVDRTQAMQPGATKPLWLARLGLAAGQGISYRIADTLNPLIFAPKPLYNTLQSRPPVSYYNYVSGKGIDFTTPSGNQPVTGVDVDGWMRNYLGAIDTIFSPEYLAPVALVDRSNALQKQLRGIKEQLAKSLSHLVIPFFTDETPSIDQSVAAQETFKQQALIALSNVYAVDAVVQFGATVTAMIDDSMSKETPQLYGTLLAGPASDTGVSLTAAKVALSTTVGKTTTPLTFLVTATKGAKDSQGALKSVLTLDLTYRGSQIEHQIVQLPNIENYTASSWLSFVTQPDPDATNLPLDAHLGPFLVPLPLRIFPTPPSMISQEAVTASLRKPVTWQGIVKAMQWSYSFTYSESFHYPQDQTHFTTTFNIPDGVMANFAVAADPVPALFEFITAYPQVQVDLTGTLAGITQQSSADDVVKAAAALGAFVQLVQNVSTALETFLPLPQEVFTGCAAAVMTGRGQLPYTYVITESSAEKVDPNGTTISALLTELRPVPPVGIGTPSIGVGKPLNDTNGYNTEKQTTPPPNFDFGYCYTRSTGEYLPDGDGQQIPKRTVVLPGLNILSAQSALTFGYIARNQDLIHGRTTAVPFVYQTAPVAFPTALRPTITIPNAIDVASFGGNTPVPRSFASQLTNLFSILFAQAPAGPQTIQVATAYAITLNNALPTVGTLPVPISFLPPTAIQPELAALHPTSSAQGVLTQQQLIAALRAGVYAWWNAYNPQPGGSLIFNLTIMTSTQGASLPPMPLLVLEKLTLNFVDWSDHPLLPTENE